MDPKKLAMIIGISVLLPLFLIFFIDAVYSEPVWENYCNTSLYQPYSYPKENNCTDYYSLPEVRNCISNQGNPLYSYDSNNCQVFEKCDYCQKEYEKASQEYNRNIFFIIAPIGLLIVIIGIYLATDYIGAGLMFGGLITLFYATLKYFSNMSKLLRSLVLLIELLLIIYIGYKKIEDKKRNDKVKLKRR